MEAPAQVVIGVDAHKRTHTLVAADELGRELASKTLAASTDGHLAAIAWADRWPARRWALEDCRHLTRTLEADLLRAGEQVVRVPTQMMAGVRRSARTRGKSDAIDALAIARAAWREPDLPVAQLDGPSRQVGCWSTIVTTWSPSEPACRAGSAGTCTRSRPTLTIPARGLKLQHVVERVAARLASTRRPDRRDLPRAARPRPRAQPSHQRTRTPDHTAHPRARPDTAEHPRLRRADRRQARRRDRRRPTLPIQERLRALERHRTSTRQLRQHHPLPPQPRRQPPSQRRPAPHRAHPSPRLAPGRDYITKRLRQGNTKAEALRLLRRRLSDVVYRTLLIDELAAHPDLAIHTHKT